MNAQAMHMASARHLLCLAASILGLMVLAFGVAPGTVLASSTTDVYTEEPPPPTPKPNNNGNNNGNGSGNNQTGNSGDGNSDDGSGYVDTGSDPGYDDTTSTGGDKPVSNKDKSDKKKAKNQKAGQDKNSEDSTVAASPAGGDSDGGGGSALPLIIAILIGVPLIGAGAWYLWRRFQSPDDETREKLKSAVSGGKSASS